MGVKSKVKLIDNKRVTQKILRLEKRHVCADASWVKCPYDALVLEKWCNKPDVECEHRGGLEMVPVEDYILVDLDDVI